MIGHHWPVVLGPCKVLEVIPRLAEMGGQKLSRLSSQVEPGIDAELVHFRRSHRPDAMKFADGQLCDEGWPHLWRYDEQAVGLAVVGRQLCNQLVVGDPGRGGQSGLLAYCCLDFFRNRRRRASID